MKIDVFRQQKHCKGNEIPDLYFSKFTSPPDKDSIKQIKQFATYTLNSTRCCKNYRLGRFSEPPNLQFCVQVFSADIEFHESTHEERKPGILYCVMKEGNFKTALQKED